MSCECLTPDQENEVKEAVIRIFGIEVVENLDRLFFELQEIRIGCKDNMDFLMKLREKHGEDGDQVVAAVLYGMKLGELGLMYHIKEQELNSPPGYQ